MKRRWLKLWVLVAGLGLASFAYLLFASASGGINRMSVLRIKVGMSCEEVDAVIGLPHGDYSKSSFGRLPLAMYFGSGEEVRFWYGNTGTITVWFANGKVTGRYFSPSSASFFDRFYQWIGIHGAW